MSLETWKAEFYPKRASRTTKEEAVAHSLAKWIGLRPDNLAKHNVLVDGDKCVVPDDDEDNTEAVQINGETCALCFHYHDDEEEGGYVDDEEPEDWCGKCPLKLARGGATCDDRSDDEIDDCEDSPWFHYSTTRDPEPMIFWLQKAAEL